MGLPLQIAQLLVDCIGLVEDSKPLAGFFVGPLLVLVGKPIRPGQGRYVCEESGALRKWSMYVVVSGLLGGQVVIVHAQGQF